MASLDPILWLQGVLPDPAVAAFALVTHLGSGPAYGVAAGAAVLGWDRRRGLVLAWALLLGAAANAWLKAFFGWARPPARLHRVTAHGLGFPSGHAQTNGVFWGTLARMEPRRAVVAAGAGAVVLVSLSRVVLGVHYVRDVVAGAAVGLALAGLVWTGERGLRGQLAGASLPLRLGVAAGAPVPLAWAGLRGYAPALSGALAGLGAAYVLEGEAFAGRPAGLLPLAGGLAAGTPVAGLAWLLPPGPVLDWVGAFLAAGVAALAGPELARRRAGP